MLVNGIDLDGLLADADTVVYPAPVKGRVAHIDADFLAYQVSYEKESDPKSLEDMYHNCKEAVNTLRLLAGAEQVHLHLTPSTSNKGGRYDQAILKEYQGNRIDKPKPRYLHIIRDWMGRTFPATLHQQCEADDGMSSAQYQAIAEGKRDLSIIVSKDKDLNMVPGLHMDWDSGAICDSDTDFGSIRLDRSKSSPKIKGYGQKFFWAQLLMGDSADNISGLPKVPGYILNRIKPTQQTSKAEAVLSSKNSNDKQKAAALKLLNERPFATCGAVMTYEILKDVTNNREAFELVMSLYKYYGDHIGMTHWSTGNPVAWNKVFISECQLLWMRKDKHNPMCVTNFLKEISKK